MKTLRLITLAILAGSAAVAVASNSHSASVTKPAASTCCDNPIPLCDPSDPNCNSN